MLAAPASACSASVSTLANTTSGLRLGRLLERGGELAARAAPLRPEVHEHDVVVGHGLLERVGGQLGRCHGVFPRLCSDRSPCPTTGRPAFFPACATVGRMPNRLAAATSPYLLQHADNPVDWWEWSPEAFAEARERDVPVLLSVGYAACHWCHVMAHESFEDEATAAYMNEHFVNVKVDREERPDVDAVYMAGDDRDDRAGRLADDGVADPDGRAVLRRHLLPGPAPARAAGVPAGPRGARRGLDEPPRRGRQGGRGRVRPPAPGGRRSPAEDAARRRACSPAPSPRWPATSTRRTAASAAPRSSRRRWCWSSCSGTPRAPAPPNASGMADRHAARRWPAAASTTSSPAGSRATGRPRLGGAALREDALRQRAAARRLRPLVAADRRPAGRAGRPRDRRLPARRAAHRRGRVRLGAGRRHRGRGGHVLRLDARRSWSRCSGADDGAWAADAARGHRGRHLRARRAPRCSCSPTPTTPSGWASVRGRLLAARAHAGAARPATTRWWPPGTVSRSRRWPRRASLLGEPRYVDAARRRGAGCCVDRAPATAARLRRVSRDGVVGRHAGVLEDYACVADGLPGAAVGHRRRGLAGDRPARCSTRALAGFAAGDGGFFDTADGRRAAGVPAPRPLRQRQPLGPVGAGARPARLRRGDRLRPAPRRRGGGAAQRPHARRARAAVRRLVAGRRGGRAGRPARGRGRGRRRRPGPRRARGRSPGRPRAPGLGVVVGEPSDVAPGEADDSGPCRCWPAEASWTAARRRTSAAGWSATGRSPTRPTWPGPSAAAADRNVPGHGEGEGENAFPFEWCAVPQGPSGS